ncbi:sensor histidine kinase [Halarcobacter sp.]|uniref:sensor histidine kinase n=1 Tax=Halarcobacter sp. TaxID=2321133 RepID=UPI003A92D868
MSRVEIESFIKSFLLFFISLTSITALRYYEMYENKIYLFEERLFSQMKISSFNNEPTNFIVTNVPKSSDKISNVFSFNKNQIFVLFEMKDLNNSLVKVSYPLNSFLQDRSIILEQVKNMFYQSILIMFIISILFSLYALHPLKKSLSLTNEFIKDILHDFNTPLSTVRLNARILKNKMDNKNVERIERSVDTIVNLQNNLRTYLESKIKESEVVYVEDIILQRVDYIKGIYPHIKFEVDIKDKRLFCYKDGLVRILDNILSNACKYNKENGEVMVSFNENYILEVTDTGVGIKKPRKIFKRFYKETSRGLGIGLHIVKKLSNEMNIGLCVKSQINIGTTFKLNLTKLIHS